MPTLPDNLPERIERNAPFAAELEDLVDRMRAAGCTESEIYHLFISAACAVLGKQSDAKIREELAGVPRFMGMLAGFYKNMHEVGEAAHAMHEAIQKAKAHEPGA